MIEPPDEHNRALIANVHPPGWVNPTPPAGGYDMIVIGAGTAGLITAIGSAGLGKRVALIERHLMGGDCLNVGCVPSKAIIAAANVAATVRDAPSFGVKADAVTVDFPAVMQRMRRLRAAISPHDSAKRYAELGVDVYLANARFTGPDTIDAGGATLRFRRACIATGSRPAVPPIPGLDSVAFLTNESLFELTELPRRLGVIGAGPIGCEMAQAFARLGARVALIEAAHGVLPADDADVGVIVRRSLECDGVKVLCCGEALTVSPTEGGGVRLRVDSHGESHDEVVDKLLIATGRTPNVEGLDLDLAGVGHGERGVVVDDHLRTTNRRIFAAGDVCSRYRFTHTAEAMARIVVRNALLGWLPMKPRASRLVIPRCTYTDPEVAHVGATARELEDRRVRHETVTIQAATIDRAILESQTDGFLKVHVTARGRILGATLVSRHAGESIGELTTAIVCGVKLQRIAHVIHPYPTQAEAIKRAGDEFFKSRLLALRRRVIFWK